MSAWLPQMERSLTLEQAGRPASQTCLLWAHRKQALVGVLDRGVNSSLDVVLRQWQVAANQIIDSVKLLCSYCDQKFGELPKKCSRPELNWRPSRCKNLASCHKKKYSWPELNWRPSRCKRDDLTADLQELYYRIYVGSN